MTNRRKPAQRTTNTEWKPGRPRAELLKAIGGAVAVVLVTALVIFLIQPGDSGTSVPSQPPGATIPTGSTPPSSDPSIPSSTPPPSDSPTGSTGTTGTAPAPTPPSSTP